MRLDKFLAKCGKGTRSQVKKFIHDKRVSVNGIIPKSESYNVDENSDVVLLDDEQLRYKEFYYLLLNKPSGYVSAVEDNVYPPITDLVSEYAFANLFPVGRLDVDTTGTILLTNNGVLCHQLLSPKNHVDKVYSVKVDKQLVPSLIKEFKDGIILDGEKTLPGELVILDDLNAELTIHQGKFHQVKRMFQHFNYKVVELDRKRFAFLNHDSLTLGEYRELSKEEEKALLDLVK